MQFPCLLKIVAVYSIICTTKRTVQAKRSSGCVLTMNSQNHGTVTSPGYPSAYPMAKCVRVITAPSGKQVSVDLVNIDIYKSGSTCTKKSDKLFVDALSGNKYVRQRTWCGSTLPNDNTYTSTGNIVRIKFKPHKVGSNYVNSRTGFNITVNFVGGSQTTTTPTPTTVGANDTTTTSSGSSCGISKYPNAGSMGLSAPRIIGGIAASNYEFPWLVVLYKTANLSPYCGGSILNKRWILTAAHCVDDYLSNIGAIKVGVHVKNIQTRAGAQILSISQIISHNFVLSTFNNDIALIKVNSDIVYSDEVQPICLPEAGNLYKYRKSVIAGWGATSQGSGVTTFARYATMNITTNLECNQMMQAVYTNALDVNANMVCSTDNNGNTDRDTCQGDSGGPMTVKESDGTFRIVGITSWGYGCAAGTPGVYTRMTRYLNWIQSRIGN